MFGIDSVCSVCFTFDIIIKLIFNHYAGVFTLLARRTPLTDNHLAPIRKEPHYFLSNPQQRVRGALPLTDRLLPVQGEGYKTCRCDEGF